MGVGQVRYDEDWGGVKWWNGPDEDLGYVIAKPIPDGTQPNPIGIPAYVGFSRSEFLTEISFVELTNYLFGQTFTTGNQCKTYLNSNGYWTSWVDLTPTPTITPTNTPTPTPTPTSANNLLVYLDSGNVSSYPTTGNTWFDLEGVQNNATLINTPTYSPSYSGILQFDDVSLEYATIPNIGNLTNWTVEIWFRLTTSLTGKITSIISNQFDLVNKLNFSIGTNNQPTNANLAVGFYDGAWRTTTGFVPAINTWYQVVGTYDGSVIRQYVNGSASGGTVSYVGTPQSGGEVRLMRRWDSPLTSGNLVDGDLAIVKIYNTALNSTQILDGYNNTYTRFIDPTPTPTPTITPTVTPTITPTPTPTATSASIVTDSLFMELDASSYTTGTWSDETGNGNNATINGATWQATDGGIFDLDGINDTISIPHNSSLSLSTTQQRTIQVWVKFDSLPALNTQGQPVFGKLSSSFSFDGYWGGLYSNGGNTRVVTNGTSIQKTTDSTSTPISINTWYLYTFISQITSTSNTTKVYINTTEVSSNAHGSDTYTESNTLYLGFIGIGVSSPYLDGKIGACYFYTKGLSAAEVTQNFNATKSKYGL